MPATKKNDAKPVVLSFRMSQDEVERLDAHARARHMTRGAVARDIIRNRALRPPSDDHGVEITRLQQLRILFMMLQRRESLSEDEARKLTEMFDAAYEKFFAPVARKERKAAKAKAKAKAQDGGQ